MMQTIEFDAVVQGGALTIPACAGNIPDQTAVHVVLSSAAEGGRGCRFSFADMMDSLPGAILVYRADIHNEEILYANSELIRLFDCDSYEDFIAHTHGTWKGFVHPDDYGRVEETIWRHQNNSGHRLDYIQFRVTTKRGIVKELDDIGQLVDNPLYGKVFYVFLHDMGKQVDVIKNALLNG